MKKLILPVLISTVYGILFTTLILERVLPLNGSVRFISFIIDLIIFFLLLKWLKRKYYFDNITFKTVLISGVLIGVFSAFLVGLFSYIFLTIIDPTSMEVIKMTVAEAKQKAIDTQGTLLPFQEKLFSVMLTPLFQSFAPLAISILFGTLFSLISAAILKTKKPL
ncbi:MAG: DUF4199 domain-containing protein [Bacteroidota bacterium]